MYFIKKIPADRRTVGQLRAATARLRLNFKTRDRNFARVSPVNLDPRAPRGRMGRGHAQAFRRAPSAPVGAEFRTQPADLHSIPSARADLSFERDLGASRRANNAQRVHTRSWRACCKKSFFAPALPAPTSDRSLVDWSPVDDESIPLAVVLDGREPLPPDSTASSKPARVCKDQLACLSQPMQRSMFISYTGSPDFPSPGSSTKCITELPFKGLARSESIVQTDSDLLELRPSERAGKYLSVTILNKYRVGSGHRRGGQPRLRAVSGRGRRGRRRACARD
eukprot:6193209-Pleurochrysis_carterae.AAC.1